MNPIENLKQQVEFNKRDICITLAKRDIIDNIYRSARLEGIATTFLDTERIYNGMDAHGFKVDEVITIVNLKHAWWFILGTLDELTTYNYICQIHKEVGNMLYTPAGYIRSLPVRIGGTSWKPAIPIESVVKENIEEILTIEDNTMRALTMMCYFMRTQAFIDGNKRTSMLVANHILISTGTGILSIPIELQDTFKIHVVEMYETGVYDKMIGFLTKECIQFI